MKRKIVAYVLVLSLVIPLIMPNSAYAAPEITANSITEKSTEYDNTAKEAKPTEITESHTNKKADQSEKKQNEKETEIDSKNNSQTESLETISESEIQATEERESEITEQTGDDVQRVIFTDELMAELDKGVLTISGIGMIPDYEKGASPLEEFKKEIISIRVGEGITAIGNQVFADCINVEKIELPDSLVTIGNYTFSNNVSLRELNLPRNITKIGTGAFYNDINLNVTGFPESLKVIEESAFYNCYSNKMLADKNTNVGAEAFFLSKHQIIFKPDEIYLLADGKPVLFGNIYKAAADLSIKMNSEDLESILTQLGLEYNQTFEKINDYFDYLVEREQYGIKISYTLEVLELIENELQTESESEAESETVTEQEKIMESDSEADTETDTEDKKAEIIQFSKDVKGQYTDGVLTITGKGELPDLTMDSENPIDNIKTEIESIIIQEGITGIGNFTFRNCLNVENLQLPDSLRVIGKYAFAENYCLSEVQLPRNLEIIKEGAFNKDVNLQIESFPESLKKIEGYAFYNCFMTSENDAQQKGIEISDDAFYQYPRYVKLQINSYSKTDSSGNRNYVGDLYFNAMHLSEELQETEMQDILNERGNKSGEKYKDLKSYFDALIKKNYSKVNLKYKVSIVEKKKGLKNAISPYAATIRNASTQAELVAAISQSGSGDVINITKNMTIKNVVITNKNITIRASGGNRTITPANGNNVTAFIINGNSKVTFSATGTHTASSGSAANNKLYIGSGSSKGTGNCINSSNIIVQGSARVNINSNVIVRNSRYHTVYGDPNTTICLDGGTIMNTSGVTAVNGGSQTFGIGSYGTILIKDGLIYCASTNRKEQYGQGVHSNGGTITVSGGSIYNCNVGVGVNHGNGANGGNKEDAYATFKGGYIYNNDIGIQINNSLVDISSVYVGLSSYSNTDTYKAASNSTYGISITSKGLLWIESAGRIYHTGNEAIHNEGMLDITNSKNDNRTKIWGNATYGIRNTSTGSMVILGVMIDGAKTGILNENSKIGNCIISNSPFSTKGTLIQKCTLRGILNNGDIEISIVTYGTKSRLEIINNGSGDKGGGIYNNTGKTCEINGEARDIDSIRINSNKGNFGGGIYNDGKLTIDGSVSVSGNTASASGGGIYNNNKLTVEGARILNNIAATYGGGIMNKNTLSITGGEIGGNRATANSGGGICNDGGTQGVTTTLTISNGKIYGNTSNKGSGIEQHGMYYPRITIKGGRIYGNAGGYGVHNDAGSVEIKDGAGMGFSAWTNTTNFTPSNNGLGNIYNSNNGDVSILGNSNDWISLASTTNYNINNAGNLTISTTSNIPVFTGKATRTIENSGYMTVEKAVITNSNVGIYNSKNLNLNGGSIHACSSYGVYNTNTGIVEMKNADIFDNTNYGTGAGVYNLGTFNMSAGYIRSNTSSGGGGVQNNGTFRLLGGEIKNNISGRFGGGVRNDGTFTMSGGGINGNTAASGGGGIFSGRNNELSITGGSIKNNKVTGGNGGGIYTDTHDTKTQILSNATITGNVVTGGNGGGIYYNSSVNMESNNISNNSAVTGGGIVFAGKNNIMYNGSVANNTATSFGGGIQVLAGNSLALSEPSIYNNTAPSDGGINNDGTIRMTGGTIHSNKCAAGNIGGGIRLGNAGASFTITGGRIYGNAGYGIVNVLGTVNIENVSSTTNGWSLIGFEKFQNAWGGLSQAQAESKQNSIGAIYNADRLNIKGMSRIYSGSTYGIHNLGKLNMSDGANCALFGNSDVGIYNGSLGTMTMGKDNQVWLAKTGLKNEGAATLSGGALTENTKRGLENTGTFNLYSGNITNNGKGITAKFFPNGFTGSTEMGNSIYQNGILNVKGAPNVTQDIFLTQDHFITVEGKCTSKFITSMTEEDTFKGRVLANYKFDTQGQKNLYSLEERTGEYAKAKGILIDDQAGVDAAYPYQVLLDGKKVLINYLPNGGSGSMKSDIVPLTAEYTIRDNEFTFEEYSYAGWDPEAEKQPMQTKFHPGQVVIPEDDFSGFLNDLKQPVVKIQNKNKTIDVKKLVKEYGVPVSRVINDVNYDYQVDLNAIWDEAPIIDTTILEFYEGETITKRQLMDEVYQSKLGATDKEDGMNIKNKEYFPHLLDKEVKIVGLEYSAIQNGYKPIPNKITYDTDMPVDYIFDTYDKKGMVQDEEVNHKLTFQVEDSAGNITQKVSDVRVLYNNYPTLKVPENLVLTTEELRMSPLTDNDLLRYAKANDIEDDEAKHQGLTDAVGNIINIQDKVKIITIQDSSNNIIQPGDIHDVGEYFITYSVTDRFGKETQKTMKLTSVEPAELTADKIEYVRFISLKHLDTLDEHSKWDKEELRAILENETPVATYNYTHEQVLEIKELMKGLKSREDFEQAIKVIKEQYMNK